MDNNEHEQTHEREPKRDGFQLYKHVFDANVWAQRHDKPAPYSDRQAFLAISVATRLKEDFPDGVTAVDVVIAVNQIEEQLKYSGAQEAERNRAYREHDPSIPEYHPATEEQLATFSRELKDNTAMLAARTYGLEFAEELEGMWHPIGQPASQTQEN